MNPSKTTTSTLGSANISIMSAAKSIFHLSCWISKKAEIIESLQRRRRILFMRIIKAGVANLKWMENPLAPIFFIVSTFFFSFQGVVAFSSQGDRIALTQIEQMVDGQYHKLGYYDTQADNLTWFNNEQWVGGKVKLIVIEEESSCRPSFQGEREPKLLRLFIIRIVTEWFNKFLLSTPAHQVPQDRTIVRRVLRTVSLPLFICMSTISSCGILVATALIVFNIWNRHRR